MTVHNSKKDLLKDAKDILRKTIHINFDNNDHALQVFGPSETHLQYLEENVPVQAKCRGNEVTLEGTEEQVSVAEKCLLYLRDRSQHGVLIQKTDVVDCLRVFSQDALADVARILQSPVIKTEKKHITPRTINQRKYLEAIQKNEIVFGIGPAGTGKTYLAMAVAVQKLLSGEVERVILTRPAVEAGEKLGFLPGDLAEKVNPYLRPLYDALHDMIDYERAERMVASGQIEVAPLAFMRGRTLNDCFVILDEAQNTTREQMKMVLTRLGVNSRAVVTGDVTQIDLPHDVRSGLIQAVKILNNIKGISIHHFDVGDVVRHPLVAEVIKAYDRANRIP